MNATITRRAAIAALVGGAAFAAAIAQAQSASGDVADPFADLFQSPFFSLERADDTAWAAEVGNVLEVQAGALLRVVGVETFAAYGSQEADLIRPRAFIVNFELEGGEPIEGDVIHRLTHPSHGSFDLFLKTTPELPAFVQAVFN